MPLCSASNIEGFRQHERSWNRHRSSRFLTLAPKFDVLLRKLNALHALGAEEQAALVASMGEVKVLAKARTSPLTEAARDTRLPCSQALPAVTSCSMTGDVKYWLFSFPETSRISIATFSKPWITR